MSLEFSMEKIAENEGNIDSPSSAQTGGVSHDSAMELDYMKKEKAKTKAAFTRTKHQLVDLIDEEELPSRRKIKELREKLNVIQEKLFDQLSQLYDFYHKQNDIVQSSRTNEEMEQLEAVFSEIQNKAQDYLNSRSDLFSSVASDFDARAAADELDREELAAQVQQKRNPNLPIEPQSSQLKSVSEAPNPVQTHNINYMPMQQPLDLSKSAKYAPEELPNVSAIQTDTIYDTKTDIKPNILQFGHFQPTQPVMNYENTGTIPNKSPSSNVMLGQDMWKQLKRVTIPVFSGDKRKYESWKAAFIACIDNAPATEEYKLLQLRQYLAGEALKCIDNLGHSAVAYKTAKERLNRKYGGQRRQVALYLEELESFRPLKENNVKEIERLADILDIAIVNLKEVGRYEELGNGSLYQKIQKKIPEQMLARYYRWVFENSKAESVEILREWIIQEAEFQTVAAETIRGLTIKDISKNAENKRKPSYTHFGTDQVNTSLPRKQFLCKHCGGPHGIWKCNEFEKLKVPQRWDFAKQFRLCYRCLGEDHVGQNCTRSRICGVSGCKEIHHRLLHRDRYLVFGSKRQSDTGKLNEQNIGKNRLTLNSDINTKNNSDSKYETRLKLPMEGDQIKDRVHTATLHASNEAEKSDFCVLRTVPVILKNGKRSLRVNALLDDASTKTYINTDVASELGLSGQLENVCVNVLNGQIKTFETMPVEFELQSVNGRVSEKITAFTAERVTGNMEVIQWNKFSYKWQHLKALDFPNPGTRPIVDLLIGIDYPDFHYSYHDIKGGPGEPIARLTPLGWTCIGNPSKSLESRTNFARTYFIRSDNDSDCLNSTLKKFWEIEDIPKSGSFQSLKTEDRDALEKVTSSLTCVGNRYEVGIPWKDSEVELPNNYNMAYKRLQNTEKRLLKDTEIAKSYSETINQYREKGYIRKIEKTESQEAKWFLPHFPVLRPDKETTKTRIVFDASAKCEGISLNDRIHQGPKLQNELFNVLMRFRKYPVALICDVAEMYLRIELAKTDRPYHRFLWRDLDTEKTPDQFEFNRVVFGVNSSPFQAQFVVQQHAEGHRNLYPLAAETILNSTYMDDSMDSVLTEEKGKELYKQLNELWEKAGMHARKWLSNSEKVLEQIPPEDRASKVNLESGDLPATKTLGLIWIAKDDVFTFKANQPSDTFEYTKRNFLKKIATLFDPLGFLSPFTIRAKILLQEMWASGLDWDDKLGQILINRVQDWFSELSELEKIRVPRCFSQFQAEGASVMLHVFVDASKDAYGTVVYAKSNHENGSVSGSLVAAKTRVAPLLQ